MVELRTLSKLKIKKELHSNRVVNEYNRLKYHTRQGEDDGQQRELNKCILDGHLGIPRPL